MSVTGDAMARPLADTLERSGTRSTSRTLVSFGSTAAIFSQTVKEQLQRAAARLRRDDRRDRFHRGGDERHPRGAEGRRRRRRASRPCWRPPTPSCSTTTSNRSNPARARSAARTRRQHPARLLQRSRSRPRRRSSPTRRAGAGRSPATSRRSRPTVASRLLGRGSVSINSGGEKIYPEEVEGALKAHPDVFDVLVVGVPDERWGERVTALLQARPGHAPDARRAAGALPRRHRRLQDAPPAVARRRGAPPAQRQARLPRRENARRRSHGCGVGSSRDQPTGSSGEPG